MQPRGKEVLWPHIPWVTNKKFKFHFYCPSNISVGELPNYYTSYVLKQMTVRIISKQKMKQNVKCKF